MWWLLKLFQYSQFKKLLQYCIEDSICSYLFGSNKDIQASYRTNHGLKYRLIPICTVDTDMADTREMILILVIKRRRNALYCHYCRFDTKNLQLIPVSRFQTWHQSNLWGMWLLIHHKTSQYKGKTPLECPGTMVTIQLDQLLGMLRHLTHLFLVARTLFVILLFHLTCLNYIHRRRMKHVCSFARAINERKIISSKSWM